MYKSRGQASAVQMQLSAEPCDTAEEAQATSPLLHSEATQIAASKHLSGCSRSVQLEASGMLLSLHASQRGSQSGTAFTAKDDSLAALCPLSMTGYPDSCDDVETGTEQGHDSPAGVYPGCTSRAGSSLRELSLTDSLAYFSDSEDDDELARLEAKYGIHA